jgi:hypothetical protein
MDVCFCNQLQSTALPTELSRVPERQCLSFGIWSKCGGTIQLLVTCKIGAAKEWSSILSPVLCLLPATCCQVPLRDESRSIGAVLLCTYADPFSYVQAQVAHPSNLASTIGKTSIWTTLNLQIWPLNGAFYTGRRFGGRRWSQRKTSWNLGVIHSF